MANPPFLSGQLKTGMPSDPVEGNYFLPNINFKIIDAGVKDTYIRLRDVIALVTEDPQQGISPGMSSNLASSSYVSD